MSFSPNVSHLKKSIVNKLQELDANIDEELPDYIMVMVENKKSQKKMAEDLSLFLGDEADNFSLWLQNLINSQGSGTPPRVSVVRTKERSRSRSPKRRKRVSEPVVDKDDYKLDIDVPAQSATRTLSKKDNSSNILIRKGKKQLNFSASTKNMLKKALFNISSDADFRSEVNLIELPKSRRVISKEGDLRQKLTKTNKLGKSLASRLGIQRTEPTNLPQEEEEEEIDQEPVDKIVPHLDRCKFWPNCRNKETCPYIHPKEKCAHFPNCKYPSTKCIYAHPICKYDLKCQRPDCRYQHSNPVTIAASTSICKFMPNCTNPACPYVHLKAKVTPCRYGPDCRNKFSCPFSHIPSSDKLKWSKAVPTSDVSSVATLSTVSS
ncbi:hypothetical protein Ciccas_000021 [Cichlidogyrus casuarinus]|uniref:Zinc finger CCCH domain-containing protein 14 n=1 Tax=Cichlidogyrus casuarinus TaxID=1844966 RepID=A0ABD2QP65_9PLAT